MTLRRKNLHRVALRNTEVHREELTQSYTEEHRGAQRRTYTELRRVAQRDTENYQYLRVTL